MTYLQNLSIILSLLFLLSCDDGGPDSPTPQDDNPPGSFQSSLEVYANGNKFETNNVAFARGRSGAYHLVAVKGADTLRFQLTDTLVKTYSLKQSANQATFRLGGKVYSSLSDPGFGNLNITANSGMVYQGNFDFSGISGADTLDLDSGRFQVRSSDLSYLGTEVFRAKVNGVPFVAQSFVRQKNNFYNLSGTRLDGKGVHLKLNLTNPSTVSLGQGNEASFTDKNKSYVVSSLKPGTATVTKLTASRIEGDFSFEAKEISTGNTVNVTDGHFELELE